MADRIDELLDRMASKQVRCPECGEAPQMMYETAWMPRPVEADLAGTLRFGDEGETIYLSWDEVRPFLECKHGHRWIPPADTKMAHDYTVVSE